MKVFALRRTFYLVKVLAESGSVVEIFANVNPEM